MHVQCKLAVQGKQTDPPETYEDELPLHLEGSLKGFWLALMTEQL